MEQDDKVVTPPSEDITAKESGMPGGDDAMSKGLLFSLLWLVACVVLAAWLWAPHATTLVLQTVGTLLTLLLFFVFVAIGSAVG